MKSLHCYIALSLLFCFQHSAYGLSAETEAGCSRDQAASNEVSEVIKAKSALIFGITGQDGSYLAEFLLDKGYTVHGVVRRSSTDNKSKITHLLANPRLKLHYGDVTDSLNVIEVVEKANPDEIYNLAAQSHVQVSFEEPKYTADVDAQGTLNVVDAIKKSGKNIKFYQASTSELYGKVQEIPQTEATPFYPRSPYGVAKLYGFWITKNYRESYDIFACNGILFNHESPRRGEEFVTRKITLAVAAQACGSKDILYLGNLDSYRDWGFAGDYVEAMWLMLQQEKPDDFVIATGETHTVREFVEKAYAEVGITISWQGSGVEEEGINSQTGEVLVKVDPRYFRPAEVEYLLGNPAKAETELGWKRKMSFDELVKVMVQADKANSCSQQ